MVELIIDIQDALDKIKELKRIIDDAADQLGCTPGEDIVRAIDNTDLNLDD